MQPRSSSTGKACRDRLSALPDHILLYILNDLGLRAVVRSSALSRRWRHIPPLLSDLAIDVADFMPRHDDGDLSPDTVDQAMARYAHAARRLLAPSAERSIRSLRLRFYLSAEPYHVHSVGRAIADAVDGCAGTELLELDILTELDPGTGRAPTRRQKSVFRQRFVSFRDACPVAFSRLTRLTLQNIDFAAGDLPALLGACERLRVLSLSHCNLGGGGKSVVEIDAPQSQLVDLELRSCVYRRVDLVRVPRLRRVCCNTWYGDNPPVRFGCVPQLRAVSLVSHGRSWQAPFAMTDWLLPAAGKLSTLTLDFLDGALSRHECRRTYKGSAAKGAMPERASSSFEHHGLRLLEIVGYALDPILERYIKRVMERAVCLERIRLLPHEPCDRCSAERYRLWEALQSFHPTIHERELVLTYMRVAGHPYRPWEYPSTERGKRGTRRRLSTDGACSSVKIVIGHIGEGKGGATRQAEVDAFLGLYILSRNRGFGVI
ncbi:hypothetical protein ACQ4PT_040928 [Festuca glaucescens]